MISKYYLKSSIMQHKIFNFVMDLKKISNLKIQLDFDTYQARD